MAALCVNSLPMNLRSDAEERKAYFTASMTPHKAVIDYVQSVFLLLKPKHFHVLLALSHFSFWLLLHTERRVLSIAAIGSFAFFLRELVIASQIIPRFRIKDRMQGILAMLKAFVYEQITINGEGEAYILSVDKLAEYGAVATVRAIVLIDLLREMKARQPGRFAIAMCSVSLVAAGIFNIVPGFLVLFFAMEVLLFFPVLYVYRSHLQLGISEHSYIASVYSFIFEHVDKALESLRAQLPRPISDDELAVLGDDGEPLGLADDTLMEDTAGSLDSLDSDNNDIGGSTVVEGSRRRSGLRRRKSTLLNDDEDYELVSDPK